MLKESLVAVTLAGCSLVPSLIFTPSTFTQGRAFRDACSVGFICAANAQPVTLEDPIPPVNFINSSGSGELNSFITQTINGLSVKTNNPPPVTGTPISVQVYVAPPVVIQPVVVVVPPVVVPPPLLN